MKNIGIDLGNSTICVAGIGSDGNIKNTYTYSVYSTDTTLMSGDIIECRATWTTTLHMEKIINMIVMIVKKDC